MLCCFYACHTPIVGKTLAICQEKHGSFTNRQTLENDGKTYMLAPLSPRQVYKYQLKLNKAEEVEQTFLQNNGQDVRLSENKVILNVKHQKVKFQLLKTNLKASTKFFFLKGKGRIWRENKWRKQVIKEKCLGKVGQHLNFYAKQSDLTYVYFLYMPMILLLYK